MTAAPEHRPEEPAAPAAAAGATPTGMIRIGRSPARTSLPTVAFATVVAAPLLAWPTSGLVGNRPVTFLLALVGWAVLLGGGIPAIFAAYYRPVAFDPVAGLARLGRTTVALASVIAARREVTAGSTSAYLSYRFSAANGAWGRVMVAGRPVSGLRPADLRLLEQFVAATAIAAPPAPGDPPPTRRRVADTIGVNSVDALHSYRAKRLVGKDELLAELRGTPEPATEAADLPPFDTLQQQWERDDREAEPVVLKSAADTVRRIIGWTVAGVIAAGMGVIAFAAIRERSTGGLDSDTNDAVAAAVLVAAAVGLVAYLGYAIASLFSIRHAQQAVFGWLRGRDEKQVARGLPARLLVPFLGRPPAHRLRMAGGFASCLVGGIGLIAGLAAAVAVPELPGPIVAWLFLVGVVMLGLGVVMFRQVRRAMRAQHQLAARLGGRRLAEQLTGTG